MQELIPPTKKRLNFHLRFSILSIFVILFVIAFASMIELMNYRFTQTMTFTAFNLMKQSSAFATNKIITELSNAEVSNQAAARLIELNVIGLKNQTEIIDYSNNIMQHDIKLFPSVQSIIWGDEAGSYVAAEKQANGTITTETVDYSKSSPTQYFIYRNLQGDVIKEAAGKDLSFDPRTRPWYIEAKKAKHTIWTNVYTFRISGFMGISVATPIITKGQVTSVIKFNLRLDYLQHLMEGIHTSTHGLTFIVQSDGKLVAFPKVNLYKYSKLIDIHSLTTFPWISYSYDQYLKDKNQHAFSFQYSNQDYLATYYPISSFGPQQWLIGTIVPEDDFIGKLRKTKLITMAVSLGILLIGIIAVSILTSRIVRPLKKITNEIKKIKNFNLEESERINSRIREVSSMADALHSMKQSLRSFQKYVPASLVRQLVETGEDARIGGTMKTLAVLFTDIQNFTTIAEQINPDQLTRHICDYFDELSHIIVANEGTIDKYIGDSIMAFWGAPMTVEFPAYSAAKAALACSKQLAKLNARWEAEKKPVFITRIGIHLGPAVVGNLGSSERLNYTAIGDTINMASRLEGINKIYGTKIIVSDIVYQEIKNQFVLRFLDCVTVKGKAESHSIYELISEDRNQLIYDIDAYTTKFNLAYSEYKNRLWDAAIKKFTECLTIYPADTVAPVFIERCKQFKITPPSDTWSGVWLLYEK